MQRTKEGTNSPNAFRVNRGTAGRTGPGSNPGEEGDNSKYIQISEKKAQNAGAVRILKVDLNAH